MREEVSHALGLLAVSVFAAIGLLAFQSDEVALIGWPASIGVVLLAVLGAGALARLNAKLQLREKPEAALESFELSWLLYVVPAGIVLSVPLVVAGKFPTSWVDAEATAQVLRLVLAFAVVESIKLLALDGEWLKNRMAQDARKMFREVYEDADFARLSTKWLAVFSDDWQGGWSRSSRAKRAEALALPDEA